MSEIDDLKAELAEAQSELEQRKAERLSAAVRAEIARQAPGAPLVLSTLAAASLKRDEDAASQVSLWLQTDEAKSILKSAEPAHEPKAKPAPEPEVNTLSRESFQPKRSAEPSSKESELSKALSDIASGKAQIRMSK